ncbi:MAG: type II toxin-antitoxin system VapC family toxin [Cellulomonas sp.]|nr:type II toxin-antitoxin system VapC family toxin [Cellulomonas sp.]
MKVLLDTHVLLWAAYEPARLGPTARTVLQVRGNQRFVSVASLWEMGIKRATGKLPEAARILDDVPAFLSLLAATVWPVATAHALLAPTLTWDHKDPFDRMLAAQALVEDVPLMSVDQAFDAVPGLTRLW